MDIPIIKAESRDDFKVLVVYSSEDQQVDHHQRILDSLIGHFTSDIKFKAVSEVTEQDLQEITHLFYYGQVKDRISQTFRQLLNNYDGVMVALGHNSKQLGDRFNFVTVGEDAGFIKMRLSDNREQKMTVESSRVVFTTEVNQKTKILAEGVNGMDQEFPLFMQHNKTYYYASDNLDPPSTIIFGEVLHEVFEVKHDEKHPAYIRLEDIHPLVDPNALMKIAKELKRREMPYMIAVIPVYKNPETGKLHHFSDYPKLLEVLQYMQENGGSIVMHGYTHQYRDDETGEGFEFWDVNNNRPVYQEADQPAIIKTEEDFANKQVYQEFQQEQIAFESKYVEDRIKKGIQELVNNGLYPLAFEAPHYTMSQNGYRVVSEHFSTYVGQVQISDHNWKSMTTVPYISSPTFFHGMQLLPETLGFLANDTKNNRNKTDAEIALENKQEKEMALENIKENAKHHQLLRDGTLAAFFHPYLLNEKGFGLESFKELMNDLEKIEGIEWIDLKKIKNKSQTEHIIIASGNGQITTEINYLQLYLSNPQLFADKLLGLLHKSLWALASAGLTAVSVFSFYIAKSKIQQRKVKRRLRLKRVV
ncbi:hypothetical protein JCM21714_3742 [Gracilibacillus boraciitolerans JCM 21714]|uniref:DUF2334 domain-containing protein n=2 Tax=Gracilibacillus boraciitolerans TaxID=307521 RepID=W4VN09_9BACI|nr:hypothetical protein JCM21714_3742 [Gracilibacillus boraciitolerans JCM 21714]